jgi:hypothetical protein
MSLRPVSAIVVSFVATTESDFHVQHDMSDG